MKFILMIIFLFLSGLIAVGCSENRSKAEDDSTRITSIPENNMCGLLTKETMSSITGIAFNETMVTLHLTDKSAGKYVSQCGYYSDGADIAVLVRRFGNTSFPKEKEKIIGAGKTGDAELDAMLEDALASCKTIPGLGDAAYFYNLNGTTNLVVIYNDYYQVHISCYGKKLGFDDNTLGISKKVVSKVITLLK